MMAIIGLNRSNPFIAPIESPLHQSECCQSTEQKKPANVINSPSSFRRPGRTPDFEDFTSEVRVADTSASNLRPARWF